MTLNSHHNGEPSVIRINQIFWKLIPVQEILVESFTFWIFVRAWCNVSEFENILLHLFVHTLILLITQDDFINSHHREVFIVFLHIRKSWIPHSLTTSIESHLLIPMSAIISADLQTLQTEIVVNLWTSITRFRIHCLRIRPFLHIQ